MIVMPANLVKMACELQQRFAGRLGLIFSPDGWQRPRAEVPYVLDNGRFVSWSKGLKWDEGKYETLLSKAKNFDYPPEWILVPDVVANPELTIKEWKYRHKTLKKLGWPLALAVQDGMKPKDVKPLSPDVVFVGGTTRWKWETVGMWCKYFPRVHVGRVNTYSMLWGAHLAGAESCDGTGWYHHKQKAQLIKYLDRSSKGLGESDYPGFFY